MKWEEFLKISGRLPIVDSQIFLAGVANPKPLKVQISRWKKAGKLIQLKRGIYLLSEAYRKIDIYEPYIASLLKRPSYISLEKAMEYHGLIPEAVSVYTSVTTKMPAKFTTKAGIFHYRHIRKSLFWGYESVTVNKQTAFIALPEKALLDFIYLSGVRVSADYIEELRLQNVEKINLNKLFYFARRFRKPGILAAAKVIENYIRDYLKREAPL